LANLKILDYMLTPYDTGIPEEDATEVVVTVISGEERLIVLTKTGKIYDLDAADFSKEPRMVNLYDTTYIVKKDLIPLWNRRTAVNWNPNVEVFDFVS
jgi:hypothetical protein